MNVLFSFLIGVVSGIIATSLGYTLVSPEWWYIFLGMITPYILGQIVNEFGD